VPTCRYQKCPFYDMDEVKGGDRRKCSKPKEKLVPLSLHEEHGRSLGANERHKASDMEVARSTCHI
jgi:hypothetical protein